MTIIRSDEDAELKVIENKNILNFSVNEDATNFIETENSAKFQNRILSSLSSDAIGDQPIHLTYISDDFFWCAEYLFVFSLFLFLF